MSPRVVVVGAGIAGTAAAWSARRRGAEVTVVSAGAGASALGSGAVDDAPWERIARASAVLGSPLPVPEISSNLSDFAADLALWDLPASSVAWIATAAGMIRPARGRDRALLDLGPLRDALVLLPRADRAAWDADALAAALAADPFSRARGLAFRAIDAPVLRFDGERRVADGDLAARHDDDARVAWLAEHLRGALSRHGGAAVLLGPWLGARSPRAEALSRAIGAPAGEILIGAGSPAGLRFEAARDRLLASIGARVVRDRAEAVEIDDELLVSLASAEAPLVADAVVLAVGGLVGGGLTYSPPEHGAGPDLPARGGAPYTLSVRASVTLASSLTSSLHGPVLDLDAWPDGDRPGALEAAGVRCEGVRAAARITAAGDVIADRPRTALEAAISGLRAGEIAASRGA